MKTIGDDERRFIMTMLQMMTEEEILREIDRRIEMAMKHWDQVDDYEHTKARKHELETIKGFTEEIRRRMEDK